MMLLFLFGPFHQRWVQYRFGHFIKDGVILSQAIPLRMSSIQVWPLYQGWVQYRSGHSICNGFHYQPATPSKMGFNTGSATWFKIEHWLIWLANMIWEIVNLAVRSEVEVIH
jgi:hypothetical protein